MQEAFHSRDKFQFVIALLGDVIFYNEQGIHVHCGLRVVGLVETP
jgi:hypothetical protein